MTIRGIDSIRNFLGIKGKNKVEKTSKKTGTQTDKVELSEEGRQLAEVSRATEMVKAAEDIRPEKVERAKQLIESGEYNKPEVIETVAERIMKSLGIG